jgi:hypothetical protein
MTNDSKAQEYGSHLFVLKYLFSVHEFHTCIEFGLGIFSTNFFLQHDYLKLISVETDLSWINYFGNNQSDRHSIVHYGNDNVQFILNNELSNTRFDLAFVDGPRNSRWQCINKLIDHTDIIVAHDTNKPSYNWQNISIPEEYIRFDFVKLEPWTAIFSKNKDLNIKLRHSEIFDQNINYE